MQMRSLPFCLVALLLASTANAQFVAEQITVSNAGSRLFGGTDADGGVGDWYFSNGVIEAIVDEAASQTGLPSGVAPLPKQSKASFTGGSLLDLALVGADNDQLSQLFTVGGLSSSNFVVYDSASASTTAGSATVTVTGTVEGFAPLTAADLVVVTEYIAEGSNPYVTIRTTVTNNGSVDAGGLGSFLDVIPWTTRAIVPFSPLPGRGFTHGELDMSNPLLGLELPVYAVGPGNVSPADGMADTQTGTPAGEVSYGLLGVQTELDLDGPGGADPTVAPVNRLFGISGVQATSFGGFPVTGAVPPGGILTYERRLYVGDRNDVASSTNLILAELAGRLGFATGTISGDVDASDTADVKASAIATRTSGPAIANLADGAPVTQFRTDATGGFAGVVLPEGTYDLEFRAVNRDPVVLTGVSVSAGGDTPVSVPLMTGLGTLELEILEAVPGPDPLVPGKVTIVGIKGTPDPEFARDFEAFELQADGSPDVDLHPESFGGALAQGRWVYLPAGTASAQLRPGKYEIFASRGLEYSVKRRRVRIREGKTARRKLRLRRIVDTTGALSADFHIHSARSFDASAMPVGRVATFAGEGVEVMVGTDHDFVIDYGPVIASLGLEDHVTSIVGTELTTTVPNPPAFPESVGHINAWPLQVDATARRDGSPEDEYLAPNFLFSRLRDAGAEVIQYNHPRAGTRGLGSIGFFNTIGCNRCENNIDQTCTEDSDCPASPEPQLCQCVGYQPDRPITAVPNDTLLDDDVTGASGVANPDGTRNIDFDVMEIGNGLNNIAFLQIRADWFSLLNQAFMPTPSGPVPFIPGTGVSDSHRYTLESAGFFRTYVMGSGDEPTGLDVADFNARIKAGRMMATTGPYIEFSVRDTAAATAGLGETLVPASSEVTLSIRVQATNWIGVDEVRVLGNGQVLLSFDATTTPAVRQPPKRPWSARRRATRFEQEVSLNLSEDTWLIVEAGALLDPLVEPDEFADTIVPGLIPMSFTNPIFIDLGGDGFDAPGLSAPVPAAVDPSRAGGATPELAAAMERYRKEEQRHHFTLRKLDIGLAFR